MILMERARWAPLLLSTRAKALENIRLGLVRASVVRQHNPAQRVLELPFIAAVLAGSAATSGGGSSGGR